MILLRRIVPTIDVFLAVFCSMIVIAFATLLALQVGLRHLSDTPLFWVEELCRFLLIWLTFMGSALAWGRRGHISIDFVLDLVGDRAVAGILVAVDVIMLGFAVWAIYAGWEYASASMSRTSISLGIPTGIAYLGVPIAFLLIAIQTICFLFIDRQPLVAPSTIVREV